MLLLFYYVDLTTPYPSIHHHFMSGVFQHILFPKCFSMHTTNTGVNVILFEVRTVKITNLLFYHIELKSCCMVIAFSFFIP